MNNDDLDFKCQVSLLSWAGSCGDTSSQFPLLVIEQALIVLKPGLIGNIDGVMALTEGRSFMVTGNGKVFVVLV